MKAIACKINTSGTKVPKTLSDRLHVCPDCWLTLDRDHNAAINIKYLAVGHSVNKAQVTSDAIAGVTEKPALYASA
ncbi:zinc ribbon domain-containing protein [Halotia wernerae UHCC 0503]|nr:zinc ribbon domain-containing protein [Halotia wernerae UHCC 0503]